MTRNAGTQRFTYVGRRLPGVVALVGFTAIAGFFPESRAQQTKAGKPPINKESAIRRLQPADVAELPTEFVEKLKTRGCTIPQFDSDADSGDVPREATNVIHGEFARKRQKDWAVLCSNGKTSTIVIYWGQATACPSSLARLDDAHYLKAGEDQTLRYSRAIRALGEDDVGERAGITALKPLAHQGIDDRFVGKSSAFFYCNNGKWKIFPGKDASSQ
jgi:hypothetical protein